MRAARQHGVRVARSGRAILGPRRRRPGHTYFLVGHRAKRCVGLAISNHSQTIAERGRPRCSTHVRWPYPEDRPTGSLPHTAKRSECSPRRSPSSRADVRIRAGTVAPRPVPFHASRGEGPRWSSGIRGTSSPSPRNCTSAGQRSALTSRSCSKRAGAQTRAGPPGQALRPQRAQRRSPSRAPRCSRRRGAYCGTPKSTTGRAQRRRPGDDSAAHRLPARLGPPRASSRRAISCKGLHVGAGQPRPYGRANSSTRHSDGACRDPTSPHHLARRHRRRRRSQRKRRRSLAEARARRPSRSATSSSHRERSP